MFNPASVVDLYSPPTTAYSPEFLSANMAEVAFQGRSVTAQGRGPDR